MIEILQDIDGEATQKEIENIFRQYRTYMLTTPDDLMPSITAKYTLEMPSFSNVKQSAVEGAAIECVDKEKEHERFFAWFNRGLCRLTAIERRIIALAFLETEPMYNYEIYTELRMSKSKYYRLRNRALYKLAMGLGVEVYQKVEVVQ
ncbi:ArpU family phage packaging/lysis transcriptional regulator [Lysinibacillus xylanilyticus]|uniref:ArpU family phage packaging/lysis transcriptional regulator n=1 Tax=Lysinibacillus xylanilyticus TaxID=582475 RepID=UPI003D05D761